MKNTIKLISSPIILGINLSLVFALASCDSGGGDDNQSSNQIVAPPADPTNTSASNSNSGNDISAANVSNQVAFENQITTSINTVRNSNGGLAPLARNSNLDAIAASHNVAMRDAASANANPIQINHNNIQSRADQVFALSFTSYGENVAGIRNYPTNQVVYAFVDGWVNSPGHFKNIIGNYTQTGIDVLVDPTDGTIYSTQIFAR